jgi:exosortase
MTDPTLHPAASLPPRRAALVGLAAFVLVAYGPVLAELARGWLTNPQYSHGILVIPFALFLLWHRQGLAPTGPAVPTWWGVPFLALAAGMRLAGARYYIGTLEQYSLFPALVGLTLAFGGKRYLRWAWPAIAFLFFMIPLHGRVSGLMTGPLQALATRASTYLLQTVGVPATCSGNVIHLTETDVGVVEACNGLRMMVTFFALTTAVAVLSDRPWWQKGLVALSGAPIALVCNVARIAVTCLLHETVGRELADRVFHDLAGWLMMPTALCLLWLGLRAFDRIVVAELRPPHVGPAPAGLVPAAGN